MEFSFSIHNQNLSLNQFPLGCVIPNPSVRLRGAAQELGGDRTDQEERQKLKVGGCEEGHNRTLVLDASPLTEREKLGRG